MKKMERNKLVAILLSLAMTATVFAACSIDTDKLGEGISDLGNVFVSETETEKEPETTDPSEPETSDTVAEPTETEALPTPSATPTLTPTPTITPTPNPQRVDFSDYSVDILSFSDSFELTTEEFEESMHSETDEQVVFATFAGKRVVVTTASSDNIRDSINLVVDGFYSEAEGAYSRMTAKAKAEYNLTGVVEEPYAVNVSFDYLHNNRVLSILMRYDVTGGNGDSDRTVIDFASFDMLTGQYITFASVAKDAKAFDGVLRVVLENSLKSQRAGEAARAADEDEANAILEKTIPEADEYDIIYVAPVVAESGGSSISTIFGIVDGEVYSASVDMNEYADFFNRYGTSLFFA